MYHIKFKNEVTGETRAMNVYATGAVTEKAVLDKFYAKVEKSSTDRIADVTVIKIVKM